MALPEPVPGLVIRYAFLWPGPDLRSIPGEEPSRFAYGLLPSALTERMLTSVRANARARRLAQAPQKP